MEKSKIKKYANKQNTYSKLVNCQHLKSEANQQEQNLQIQSQLLLKISKLQLKQEQCDKEYNSLKQDSIQLQEQLNKAKLRLKKLIAKKYACKQQTQIDYRQYENIRKSHGYQPEHISYYNIKPHNHSPQRQSYYNNRKQRNSFLQKQDLHFKQKAWATTQNSPKKEQKKISCNHKRQNNNSCHHYQLIQTYDQLYAQPNRINDTASIQAKNIDKLLQMCNQGKKLSSKKHQRTSFQETENTYTQKQGRKIIFNKMCKNISAKCIGNHNISKYNNSTKQHKQGYKQHMSKYNKYSKYEKPSNKHKHQNQIIQGMWGKEQYKNSGLRWLQFRQR